MMSMAQTVLENSRPRQKAKCFPALLGSFWQAPKGTVRRSPKFRQIFGLNRPLKEGWGGKGNQEI